MPPSLPTVLWTVGGNCRGRVQVNCCRSSCDFEYRLSFEFPHGTDSTRMKFPSKSKASAQYSISQLSSSIGCNTTPFAGTINVVRHVLMNWPFGMSSELSRVNVSRHGCQGKHTGAIVSPLVFYIRLYFYSRNRPPRSRESKRRPGPNDGPTTQV